jgi:alpha-beta hydrolase superfamily lysophospholipase
MKFDKIALSASDGRKLVANLFPVEKPKGWLLLSHMMPAAKESWNVFALHMQNEGYESLAIDLRGHGESEGGPVGYQNFSDKEHQQTINDLYAGLEFLKSRNADTSRIVLVGASIGANLSLQCMTENPNLKKAVLLSPGLNYRGIETVSLVHALKQNQSVLFVSSKDDDNNVEEAKRLYELAFAGKQLHVYERGGHGTHMFFTDEQPSLIELIKNFISS